MKKIIGGKVYDTETARLVGKWENDRPITDGSWMSEDLYRKKTGEYFLHGFGNGLSPYAQQVATGGFTSGEAIRPLAYEAALAWAEGKMDADAYIEAFGDPGEGDEDARIDTYVSVAAKRIIDRERSRTGESVAEVIERAVKNF